MVTLKRRETATAPIYTLEDVKRLSDTHDEPGWLRAFRLLAWETYESLPMPTGKDEDWRRTDLRGVRWAEAGKLVQANGVTADMVPAESREPLVGGGEGGTLIFVDGKVVEHKLHPDLNSRGVIFTDLSTAAREHPDLVQANLMTRAVKPADGKFAALHAALWTHGVFIYIPRGYAAELPLHVVMYNSQPGATLGHVLVVIDDNAQATVQVEYASVANDAPSLYFGATELLVGEAANLRYVSLQNWNRTTTEFAYHRARIGADSTLDWVFGVMGCELLKDYINLDADGKGSNGRISGFFFADKDQLFDLDTQQNHNAPLTVTDLLFKGAARDTARTVWQGMIKSLPKMQKIDGYQANRNLLLSDDARMDGIPGLEIEADDVKCSHAATFGTLEETPIHYLMSRGIPRNQAELMVIDGFFDELLLRVPFERVRERLKSEIESKIVGTVGAYD
ncbi:MAG: Fe-S cluster assembly protein SufD [Chloroflexi bacterium]|nr:Fe-S cluster assembly protein SufD [Chloroflexota bacterium]